MNYTRCNDVRRHYACASTSHDVSVTALVSSPDESPMHTIDFYDIQDDYIPPIHFRGHRAGPPDTSYVWDCFIVLRHRVDQAVGKRRVEQGLKLYNQNKQIEAVKKWKSALIRIRRRDDKFVLLGHLFQAYMDWGKFRDSLEFAQRQLLISEEIDNPTMRAEAFLNMAIAHERMGVLDQALAFAKHSLYNECNHSLTVGLVHVTVGSIYLELAVFSKSLISYQYAHKIALSLPNSKLELQVYIGLSELFGRLRDADKSALYASKAYDLSRSLQLGNLNTRHHRAALLQMASSLCKQGELGDATDYCGEATRYAAISGDQSSYVRSLRIFGDIFRKNLQMNASFFKAFRHYEISMKASLKIEDQLCQMEAMDGAAKCLEGLRLQQKICNCRALEFNMRLLELANLIGSKLMIRSVRLRLAKMYRSLRDQEKQDVHETIARHIEDQLDLECGGCSLPLGFEADSLEALSCSHIVHARCAYDIMRKKDRKKKRVCPECHKSVNPRLYLYGNEPAESCQAYPGNPPSISLANLSLVESDMSMMGNATSSV